MSTKSPELQTDLIGARIAIIRYSNANNEAHHRYGVLRGIVAVDRYHIIYMIQPDDPEGVASGRPLYRIIEISNLDESCYVTLDPQHPGPSTPSVEGGSLAELIGAIVESASPEQLKRITAELTAEQLLLIGELLVISTKLRKPLG